MQQFTAMGNYSDGTHQNLTTSATWSSSSAAVATVNASGVATGAGGGTATITAAVGLVNGHATLKVVPQFAYVANATSNNVSAFIINANTGALTAVGPPVATGGSTASSVAVDPMGKFLYVGNLFSQQNLNISTFLINANTGALESSGSLVQTDGAAASVTVDPSGKFLYVANSSSNNVSAFRIDASTGALTPISAAVPSGGEQPQALTVDPTGKFLYVVNKGIFSPPAVDDSKVCGFTINPITGALTFVGSVVLGSFNYLPWSVTVDPTGKFLYVANSGPGVDSVSAFTINSSTGALTAVGAPVATGGNGPVSAAVHPTGKFLYVANYGSGISVFSINAGTGALTLVGSPVPTGGVSPFSVTVESKGKFVYAANYTSPGTVSQLSINPDTGELTLVGSPTATGGTFPYSVVTIEKTQ